MEKLNKYLLTLLLLTVFCFSCKKNITDKRLLLDYSFDNGWNQAYSIKVYQDGKAFLKKSTLKKDSFYVSNQIDEDRLVKIVSKLKLANIDSIYEDSHIQDAPSFNIIVYDSNDKFSKYHVYGYKYPQILNEIKDYFKDALMEKSWQYLQDTSITFSSITDFKKFPKVDTNIKFLPPKEISSKSK